VDNNYLDLGMSKSGFMHTLPSGRLSDWVYRGVTAAVLPATAGSRSTYLCRRRRLSCCSTSVARSHAPAASRSGARCVSEWERWRLVPHRRRGLLPTLEPSPPQAGAAQPRRMPTPMPRLRHALQAKVRFPVLHKLSSIVLLCCRVHENPSCVGLRIVVAPAVPWKWNRGFRFLSGGCQH
jgi:hypothetical protein